LWLLVRLILIYSTQNVANCATICKGESVRWTSTLLDMRESCMQRTQSLLCPFSGKIFLLTMSCCIYTQRHVTHALQIKASWSTILKTNDKCCRYMWIINGFLLHLLTLFLIFMKAKLLARKKIYKLINFAHFCNWRRKLIIKLLSKNNLFYHRMND